LPSSRVDQTEQFKLKREEDGDVRILYVFGSFDEHTVGRVHQAAMAIFEQNHRPQLVIIHTSDDYEFDSHALRFLGWLKQHIETLEGTFQIVPSVAMQRVFEVTGCHDFFPIYQPSS